MKKRILSLFLALTLCLTLLPTSAFAEGGDVSISGGVIGGGETGGEGGGVLVPSGGSTGEGGGIYVAPGSSTEGGGGTSISEGDTQTEIWCTMKPSSIQRSYDGTTDGSTIPIDLTFTDGTNNIILKEGTGFTAKKTFDSADAGSRTVTVEIELIGDAAAKYKLKAGEETFTIGGYIDKAYPDLTVSLSKAACTVGEKLLPLLSISGVQEDATVTYYYTQYKTIAGDSECEGSEAMPEIDENTAISEPGTYYVYAKTGETKNYKEERSATVELTVNEPVVEAASVTRADGTDGGTYESLPAALNAAQDGDTVKLLANHVTDADALNALGEDFTFEQYASIVPVVTKTLTLDLNHKTVDYLEVGFSETNEETQEKETLATGNLTVTGEAAYGRISNLMFMAGALDIRSGEIGGSGCAGLFCDANSGSVTVSNGTVYGLTVLEGASVTVNGGSNHAGEWVVASGATLNITDGTFGDVQFTRNGTIAISGGTFKSIKSDIADELQPLMSLLDTQKVHAFYKGDDVQDGNATELADVTVKEHTHTMVNSKCACGFSCTHTNAECASTIGKDGKCTVCGTQFAAGIGETYYTDVPSALNAAADGQTVKLLANEMLPDGIYVSKTLTLDLDGHSLSGYSLNVGGLTATSQVRTGNLTVIDSSGGNGAVGVTVRDGGTLVFNPENDNTTLLQLEVWGGTVELYGGKISRSGLRLNNNITLGNLLPGQAGLAYYRGDTQLTLEEAASQTCDLVVKSCSHGGKNGFDGTNCPYCNAPAVAEAALNNGEGNRLWRRFANLQTAIDADRDGGAEFKLLTDVTGDYTINGTQDTALDLYGHSIKGTVTVKGIKGDYITTTLSNTENTTTASIDKVVAYDSAELAGSGYPAVIGTLMLAEGATWNNILNDTALGYKVLNADGTHTWYAPNDVNGSQLNNVIINRLPITRKNLAFKVNGTNVKGNKVERGTTVQLCASCNAKDVTVTFSILKTGETTPITLSGNDVQYTTVGTGTTKFYVAEYAFNDVGSYTISFTATKDGYTVTSSHKKLTVTKPNLSNAEITFRSSNESTYEPYRSTTTAPGFTVTYNGKTLKLGVDYTASGTASSAGVSTQTLTIKAVEGSDYTGSETAEWRIVPHKAKVEVGDVIKAYDGTTDLPDGKISLVSAAGSAGYQAGLPLPLSEGNGFELTDAKYDSANASETEKNISFTVKLTDTNYTFEDGTTEKAFTLNGADVSQTFKISQATVTPNEITQYIYNDLAKTYTLDLAALLPELSTGCEYGKIQYQGRDFHFTYSTYLDFNNLMSVSREGILTLPIVSAHTADVNKQIGTITVPVVTTNYQRFEFTIKVVISERIPLDKSGVTVSATDITYGRTLADSTLTVTGSMICPRTGNAIPGEYTWTNSAAKPNAGSYEAEWTFTPDEGYEEYAPATGKVTVNVKPAQLQNVSVQQNGTLTYNKAMQIARVTTTATTVDGSNVTFSYRSLSAGPYNSTVPGFADAGRYCIWYRAEAANHEPHEGSFWVTIDPMKIDSVTISSNISKVYDGTADIHMTAEEWANVLTFKTISNLDPVSVPSSAYTISDAYFVEKRDDETIPSPDAGEKYGVAFQITLNNGNYVIWNSLDDAPTTSKEYIQSGFATFTINKAAAPASIPNGALNVINGTILDYTYDFKSLLPTAPTGEYGTVNYTLVQPFNLSTGYAVYDESALKFENGVLTLPLQTTGGTQTGKIGTVTVTVTTGNYQDFTLMLDLNAVNKIKLTPGDISCTEITYGQTLNESTITGTMYAVDDEAKTTPIPGTFHWEQPAEIPTNGQKFVFVFIPNENKYDTYTGELAIKVNPKSIEGAEVTVTNPTYDGYAWPYPAGVKVVLDGKTLQYQVDYTYPTLNSPAINAGGSHTVTIQGIGNYTGTIEKSWTIEPRNVPHPTLTVEDGVYNNGNEVRPTITLTDDQGKTIDPKEYNVEFENNTGVGTGTVTITDKDGGNYILGTASTTFTIAKAPAPTLTAYPVTQKYTLKTGQTITLPDLERLGMPSDAQVSGTNAFHSGPYSPAGKIQDGWGVDVDTGAITYALADGVAAGDVITFTLLVHSKNYEDATVTVKLTLTERDTPILTLPDIITVDYTGAGIPVSAVTGKRAAFDGKDVPGTWSWKAGQTITNAADNGTKTIVFTPDDPVNYLPAEGTVSVTISPVAPAYTAPAAIDGLIYSGNAQALVDAGSTAHGKLLYSLSKDGAYSETVPTGTDAGEYTVWYKVVGDNNHTDTQPASVTVTVAPKTVTATVTVSGDSLTYTGDPLKPGVIVKDGDTVISPEEYDVSYRDNVNAGTATVTVRNKAGGNYTVSGSATFEIGKAASDVKTAPGANTGLVYNGGEQTLVTTGTALSGKLKYRLGESGGFTEALPKAANAGTYTVYYMVEGDGNHRDSEIYSLTVTIGKARVTVTALDKRIYTDDKAPDLSKPVLGKDYTVTGLFGEDALTGDITLAYVDASGTEITPDTTKVGQTILRAGGLTAPNDNYTVVFADGKLTVDERPVYTVKATAGSHGSITPSGNVDVLHGGSQTFTIAANSGYAISNVKIDGVSIGAVKSYTFENVTENHTIEVTFMKANGNPQTGVMVDEVTGEYYVA